MGVYPLERMHWTARRQFPLGGGELALFSLHLRYWAMSPAAVQRRHPHPRERRLFHRFSEVEFGPISRGRNRDLGRLDLCQTSGIWDTIFFGYTCHRYFPNFFIKFLSRQTNRSGRHHCSHLLFIQNHCFSLFDLNGAVFLMIQYLQGSLKTVLSLQFLVFF